MDSTIPDRSSMGREISGNGGAKKIARILMIARRAFGNSSMVLKSSRVFTKMASWCWAKVWGANLRPEYARLMANSNEHPVPRFRVNGPLSNMELFAKAFGCKKGDTMLREKTCKIW